MNHRLPAYCLFCASIMLIAFTGRAQLCTGSLGDPVVNITFGAGPNPGAPLAAATTNYSFVTSSCPNDGSYTIINSTSGCFGDSWHTLTEDHTPGDVNGYMMLVNASFAPGLFYLDTVKNLCSTTYEFSAWILNILKASACGGSGIKPNITFIIETPVDTFTYNTGDIPNLSAPQWNQYGFYFTVPPGVNQVVLKMRNNAPGGCGNDLALDDITFRPCGPRVNAGFAGPGFTRDTLNFCVTDNKSITLTGAVPAGFANPAFQWQQSSNNGATWTDIPGAITGTYTRIFSAPGTFSFRLSSSEGGNIGLVRCRVASKPLTVIIDSLPVPAAGNTSPACAGEPVTLRAQGGINYSWTGPSGFSSSLPSPVITNTTIGMSGTYTVQVRTAGGCQANGSTTVNIHPLPPANAGPDVSICAGTSTVLRASGGSSYTWNPPTGLSATNIANPIAAPDSSQAYVVTVSSQYNCRASDTVLVTVLKKPIANAGPDKKIVEGQSVQLDGSASGDVGSYFWTPPLYINDPRILRPVVTPPGDFTYTLHVQSANGCGTATGDVFVRVFKHIVIPNVFSPNNDGINDYWNIEALDSYPESTTEVYNRYGQMVFHSRGYGKPWDGRYNGKPLPVGTYYYIIDRKSGFPLLSGWVTIVR